MLVSPGIAVFLGSVSVRRGIWKLYLYARLIEQWAYKSDCRSTDVSTRRFATDNRAIVSLKRSVRDQDRRQLVPSHIDRRIWFSLGCSTYVHDGTSVLRFAWYFVDVRGQFVVIGMRFNDSLQSVCLRLPIRTWYCGRPLEIECFQFQFRSKRFACYIQVF